MDRLHPPRQSPLLMIFYSIFLISTLASLNPTQPNTLTKRQLLDSVLNPLLGSSTPGANSPGGINRATNLNPTPSDPASNSSSTPPPNNPTPAGKDKDSPLIPLLGSSLNIPTASPNPSNNSSSTPLPPTNSTSTAPAPSPTLPANNTAPTNKSSTPTNPAASASPLPTQPSDPSSNRSPSSNPVTNNRPAESHASNDKSTFGSTTIKLLAITGGVVAGLFLLWTVIRKWKFRPSKRFASKLEDYDEHMFEPRPPSFSEKRPNEYPSYAAKQVPLRSASPGLYPSHLPERANTPSNIPRQNMFSPQGPSPYPVHRLSNVSVTKPLPIFESNYRLSLGLGSEISHSYPPPDHPA